MSVLLILGVNAESVEPNFTDTLRLMSFNIWVGGEGGMHPLEHTAEVIRAAKADIVGIQEGLGQERPDGSKPNNAKKIAEMLGWNYLDQGHSRAIMTRYEIVGHTKGRQGAEIKLPSGQSIHLFNVHLNHAPYQPYQLLKIEYADAPFLDTAEELVAAAESARGEEIAEVLRELEPLLKAGAVVALTGDFNEPSHLDWTAEGVGAGVVPMAVQYPASYAVLGAGMRDAYRIKHPDETAKPGFTWTTTTRIDDPEDRHDRIDFVYVSPNVAVGACEIVGKRAEYSDIVVKKYPSDHRSVVATLGIGGVEGE